MKTLMIGDLHGNLEVVEHAIQQRTTDRVVFIGDYLDSFNRSVEDQIQGLRLVLDACEVDPDRFTGLIGNHELSYIKDGEMCSGYSYTTDKLMVHLKTRCHKILRNYTFVDEFLVSHAGLSQVLLDNLGVTVEEYLENQEYFQVGHRRGGYDDCGGLYWCDWNSEFEPVKGTPQIVGHTHYQYTDGFKTKDIGNEVSYNIDCLPQFNILRIDHGDEARVAVVEDSIVTNENLFDL